MFYFENFRVARIICLLLVFRDERKLVNWNCYYTRNTTVKLKISARHNSINWRFRVWFTGSIVVQSCLHTLTWKSCKAPDSGAVLTKDAISLQRRVDVHVSEAPIFSPPTENSIYTYEFSSGSGRSNNLRRNWGEWSVCPFFDACGLKTNVDLGLRCVALN